jgi:hypothetical protein
LWFWFAWFWFGRVRIAAGVGEGATVGEMVKFDFGVEGGCRRRCRRTRGRCACPSWSCRAGGSLVLLELGMFRCRKAGSDGKRGVAPGLAGSFKIT